MKFFVCSMFDAASGAYSRPMFYVSRGHAVRAFFDEVRREDAQNDLNKHPEDFHLFEIGGFDDSECKFELLERPMLICRAVDGVVKQA